MSVNDNPLQVMAQWLREAQTSSARRNPLAMALATATADGIPSVRMVLLKGFAEQQGYVNFYTHHESRKGTEISVTQRAAGVLYWEEFGGRQLRIEGPVRRSSNDESDRYFASRPVHSQLNAWVSQQSRTLEDPASLPALATQKANEFGITAAALQDGGPQEIPRPSHWGGYRIWIDRLELWSEGAGRFHDRYCYTRTLKQQEDESFVGTNWQATRLHP